MEPQANCKTCKASLAEHGKKSDMGDFLYCTRCKAVYGVSHVREMIHPELGPVVSGQLQLLRPGNLNNIPKLPKPRLSDTDVRDMMQTLKDSFGPEQFGELLKERGNIGKEQKRRKD